MKTIVIEDKQRVEEIISRCDICFVGITDLEGNPYVIPMNFGYREGVIYLHSGPTGSSIDMLQRNNHVCVTFSTDHELVFQHPKVACSYRMKAKSVSNTHTCQPYTYMAVYSCKRYITKRNLHGHFPG